MATIALPYIENDICSRLSFIEPFCTGWHSVELSHLGELKEYLQNNWTNFETAVHDDMRKGFHGFHFLTTIYLSLKKFTRWYVQCQEIIDQDDHFNNSVDSQKCCIATNIVDFIEIMWIPFIHKCHPKKDDLMPPASILTMEERTQIVASKCEEENRQNDVNEMLAYINGDSVEDRNRKFEILHELVNGKKGKGLAEILEAAIKLGWLTEKPKFRLMELFWNIKGRESSLSKVLTKDGGSLNDEKRVANIMQLLSTKLDS